MHFVHAKLSLFSEKLEFSFQGNSSPFFLIRAVGYLMKAGSVVHMTVSKGAVWQHGLTLLLKQPVATKGMSYTCRPKSCTTISIVPPMQQ